MASSSDATAVYLDPLLWEQKIANQASSGIITPPDPLQIQPSGGGIKPGSMVDRARLALVPLPEAGLRCPRCDSTNTKFCYFNNYNLSQPRHFCKGCRRYWTRGGTLRNVPVGGSCRRNKRRKPKMAENSKTPVAASGNNNNNNNCVSANDTAAGSYQMFLPPPSLTDPFFPGFSHLNGDVSGFGLNWGGGEAEFEGGVSRSVDQQMSNLIAGSGGSGSGCGLYPFYESTGGMDRASNPTGFDQLGRGLKVEENHQGLSLSKNHMVGGVHGYGTDHYSSWAGDSNGWNAGSSAFHSPSS